MGRGVVGGLGGWRGRVGSQRWVIPSNWPGLFGVAMSPKSASHRPRQDWRALRDVSLTQG